MLGNFLIYTNTASVETSFQVATVQPRLGSFARHSRPCGGDVCLGSRLERVKLLQERREHARRTERIRVKTRRRTRRFPRLRLCPTPAAPSQGVSRCAFAQRFPARCAPGAASKEHERGLPYGGMELTDTMARPRCASTAIGSEYTWGLARGSPVFELVFYFGWALAFRPRLCVYAEWVQWQKRRKRETPVHGPQRR